MRLRRERPEYSPPPERESLCKKFYPTLTEKGGLSFKRGAKVIT